ncbi:MAG TPA: hypothetical protein VGA50_04565 [Kiloniellales bacterium]
MATYDSLSASDKAVVQNTVNLVRAGAGEIAKVFNHLKAIADDSNAVNLVLSIDIGQTIPNTSGLAGADDLTRTEVVDLFNLINGIRTTNDNASFRAAASKAAGINALLG